MLWCKLNDILYILSNTLVSTHLTTSAVIAVESLDRLANTMIEIGQDPLLDKSPAKLRRKKEKKKE